MTMMTTMVVVGVATMVMVRTMMTTVVVVVVVVVVTMLMVFSVGVRRKDVENKNFSKCCKTKPSWDEQVFNWQKR